MKLYYEGDKLMNVAIDGKSVDLESVDLESIDLKSIDSDGGE